MRRAGRLDCWRCARGHVYLHPHTACPACGARIMAAQVRAEAVLVDTTTVRVNPAGEPFVLGIAVTVCGKARTLCRVEGRVRESGNDTVVLERRGRVLVARSSASDRSRARRPTRAGWRRS